MPARLADFSAEQDEAVRLFDLVEAFAKLGEDPVGGRFDEGERAHPLRVFDRELDQSEATPRPAGEVGPREIERVEGQPERLALYLGGCSRGRLECPSNQARCGSAGRG